MRHILKSIEISLENGAEYSALVTTLVLPDICGKIEFPKQNSSDRYIGWFNRYLFKKYNQRGYNNGIDFLVANNCYALRCSLLHEGCDILNNQRSKKGCLRQIQFHTNRYDEGHCNLDCDGKIGVLSLNVTKFCLDVISAVKLWLKDIKNDDIKINQVREIINILDV